MSTVDLAYQVRAGELMLASLAPCCGPIRSRSRSTASRGSTSSGGPGVLFAARPRARPAGAGWSSCGRSWWRPRSASSRRARCRWLAPRSGGAPRPCRIRRGDRLAGPARPAVRHRAVRGRARDPGLARPPAAPRLADPAPRARLGEPARQLLPGSGRRRAWPLVEDLVARRPGSRRLLLVLVARSSRPSSTPSGRRSGRMRSASPPTARSPRLITEWQRTSPLSVTGALFYASVVGAGGGPLAGPRPRRAARPGRRSPGSPGSRCWAPTRSAASPGGRSGRRSRWRPRSPRSFRPRARPATSRRPLRRLNAVLVLALSLAVRRPAALWRPAIR